MRNFTLACSCQKLYRLSSYSLYPVFPYGDILRNYSTTHNQVTEVNIVKIQNISITRSSSPFHLPLTHTPSVAAKMTHLLSITIMWSFQWCCINEITWSRNLLILKLLYSAKLSGESCSLLHFQPSFPLLLLNLSP